jgi:hypothetical protein
MNSKIIVRLLTIFATARASGLGGRRSRRRSRTVGLGAAGNLPRSGRARPPEIEAFDETDQIDHKGLETKDAGDFEG